MIPNSALPFSGGLVSQGLQRIGVHDSVLLRLRVAAIFILPLLAWLPLLLLSTIDGNCSPVASELPSCSICRLTSGCLSRFRSSFWQRGSAKRAFFPPCSSFSYGGSFPKRRSPGSKPPLLRRSGLAIQSLPIC